MLEEGRRLGFLGPGPVDAHLDHAAGFADAVLAAGVEGQGLSPPLAADLGTGGGVPGLPLAVGFSHWRWALVESAARRVAFLREAVRLLELTGKVEVVEERAEVVGRSAAYRGRFDLVVARGFGPPATVAECAAPLLRMGGRLVVSEPPGGDPDRWPEDGLRTLGMTGGPRVLARGSSFQVLAQSEPCPPRYPRRVGVPAKRPLF